MDNQPKYKAQSESNFFENGATMRMPLEGTIAQGELNQNSEYYSGKESDSAYLTKNAIAVTLQLLQRGRERYDIYCSPCHGRSGDGKGIVVQRGYLPPPNFHQDYIRAYPDGQIFEIISRGIRNMPSYNYLIPVADRWAIVSYVRALQRSQNATIDDVPEELRDKIN